MITDAGMNDLIRPALYGASIRSSPWHPRGAQTMVADVVGPVCESSDFFARDLDHGPADGEGDLLAIRDAGAYGFAMSSNYNFRPRAAEVLVEATGSARPPARNVRGPRPPPEGGLGSLASACRRLEDCGSAPPPPPPSSPPSSPPHAATSAERDRQVRSLHAGRTRTGRRKAARSCS